jgi:hypothetical protein
MGSAVGLIEIALLGLGHTNLSFVGNPKMLACDVLYCIEMFDLYDIKNKIVSVPRIW